MDDIFSGMDSHTVEHISRRIFSQQGLLRQQGMTVVLVTSTCKYQYCRPKLISDMVDKLLPLANIIVVLEGGQITGAGNADSIQSNHDFLSQVQVRVQENDENWEETELAADKSKPQIQVIHGPPTDLADRDPSRRNGDFSVYRYYAEASGRRAVISFLSFMLLWAFCGQFPSKRVILA